MKRRRKMQNYIVKVRLSVTVTVPTVASDNYCAEENAIDDIQGYDLEYIGKNYDCDNYDVEIEDSWMED
jgi:hypothetical protein